jgi:Dolichyl-phosphate-mannose-protein mannosyltransferase
MGINQPGRKLALAAMLVGAATVYGYRLGHEALGASEAYSALAASQPSMVLVARSALSLDPGKPVLYHLLLHWFCRWFGTGEAGLRALSVCFGVAGVWLVFAFAAECFGFEVGFAAALLWAFNPLAMVFARWARMYSMLVALALGHLLAMAKLRRGATAVRVVVAGVLGAAMLYTHLGAILILGADMVVIAREFRREGKSVTWPGVAIAGILFLPALPMTISQSRALLFGHWLDWLGAAHGPPGIALLYLPMAALAMAWLTLACRTAGERRESFQRCLIYAAVPMLALVVGSLVLRPMFEVRYVSPSMALLAVVGAYLLNCGGGRVRNLGTAAGCALFLAMLPFCYASRQDPWRAIAATIAAAAHPGEPIFFEAGFFSPEVALGPENDRGFPEGFFRVPFDYYFKGANPRGAVPASAPARTRELIAAQVKTTGGAWLISVRKWPDASAELPRGPDLRLDYSAKFSRVSVFHVELSEGQGADKAAPEALR